MRKTFLLLCHLIIFSPPASAMFFQGGPIVPLAISSITLPSSNLQAVCSTVKYQGWNGNSVRVKRSSDNAQQDIGFVNGLMDINTALSFCGGSTCSVVTCYDESGNGNDFPNGSCVVASANEINGIPSITCWNGGKIAINDAVTTSTQSLTVFSVVSLIDAHSGGDAQWEINKVRTNGLTLINDTNNDRVLDNSAFRSTGVYSLTQPGVDVLTSSGSSKTYQFDEHLVTGIAASAAATTTGGEIYNSPDLGYTGYGELYTFAVYNTVMNQATIEANKTNLYSTFSIPTNLNSRVLFDGDSITLGTQSTNGINNPRQAEPLLSKKTYIRNIGVFGELLSTMLTNETANVINSFDGSLAKNIVLIAGGINDINASANGTTLFNGTLVPYVQAAQSAGYTVIVGTLICSTGSSGAQNTQRQAYNTLVKSNAVADGYTVADYDSITQLQCPQTGGNSADGTHPTTAGYALMAQVAATAINAVLP